MADEGVGNFGWQYSNVQKMNGGTLCEYKGRFIPTNKDRLYRGPFGGDMYCSKILGSRRKLVDEIRRGDIENLVIIRPGLCDWGYLCQSRLRFVRSRLPFQESTVDHSDNSRCCHCQRHYSSYESGWKTCKDLLSDWKEC